jgi:glucokinase
MSSVDLQQGRSGRRKQSDNASCAQCDRDSARVHRARSKLGLKGIGLTGNLSDGRTLSAIKNYGLVADIGGTNIRFGIVDLDDTSAPRVLAPDTLNAAKFGDLPEAARSYVANLGLARPPSAAALAMAGPVNDGEIAVTNSALHSSTADLRAVLKVDRIRLINDFEAIALAVPLLTATDTVTIGPELSPPRFEQETMALIGPGTGLGVAGFVRTDATSFPLVTEGGHVSFAPVNELEIEVLRAFMRRYERVSAERILSGPGLRNLYRVLAEIECVAPEDLSAEEITGIAETDAQSLCARTFDVFCAVMGSVAGDFALSFGARSGVFIAGGILPAHATLFARSQFRQRFEAKGRFEDYMKKIPTRLITQTRIGLLGAASLLTGEAKARKAGH